MKVQNLRDLEIFKHVVDGGSLRSAARALNLSPAVVSRRIASLEQSLGVPLLLRTTRSLQVTPRGEMFYRRCVAILGQVQAAERELSPTPSALSGVLRVALPTGFASEPLLRAMGDFLDANRSLDVELFVSDGLVDPRAAGLDLAIRPGARPDSTLLSRRLGTVSVWMLATPSYLKRWGTPRTREDLLDHRCLRFRAARQQDLWPLVDPQGNTHGVRVGGNLFCDSSAALARALRADLGIGLLEAGQAEAAIASGELVRVLPDHHMPPLAVFASYPKENRDSPALQAFLDVVMEVLAPRGPPEARTTPSG